MTTYKYYKLVKDDEIFYVGKTKAEDVEMRLGTHITDFHIWKVGRSNRRPLCFYDKEFSWNGVTIHQIDEQVYESEAESRKKENDHIIELNKTGKQKPNKVLNPNYKKEWTEANKDRSQEKAKQRYQDKKEEIDAKHKKYVEDHKEQIKQYKKEYVEKNKEHLEELRKKNRSSEWVCPKCNKVMTKGSKNRHLKKCPAG